jgi:hypothetical protein
MNRSIGGREFARLVLALVVFGLSASSHAADQTEPERLAETLLKSKKPTEKRLGERWQQLVRQRQWGDDKGKYRVFAKYVSHEPDFKSVKLLVFVKNGAQPSHKEVNVPFNRLGKAEQTLVKQIDRMHKQVEEAAAAVEPAEGAAKAEAAAVPEGQGRAPGGPEEQQVERLRGREGRAPMATVPGAGPEGVPAANLPPGAAPPGGAPPGYSPPGAQGQPPIAALNAPRDHNTAMMPDAAAWRTDFNAFAANLSAAKVGEDQKWVVQFGELNDLKAAYEAAYAMGHALGQNAPVGAKFGQLMMAGQAYAMAAAKLGEVTWQTTIAAPIESGAAGIKHDLKLQEPLAISLAVDDGDVGDYHRFKAGDRVKFIGRFYDLGGGGETPHITLHVRFPDDQTGDATQLLKAP